MTSPTTRVCKQCLLLFLESQMNLFNSLPFYPNLKVLWPEIPSRILCALLETPNLVNGYRHNSSDNFRQSSNVLVLTSLSHWSRQQSSVRGNYELWLRLNRLGSCIFCHTTLCKASFLWSHGRCCCRQTHTTADHHPTESWNPKHKPLAYPLGFESPVPISHLFKGYRRY